MHYFLIFFGLIIKAKIDSILKNKSSSLKKNIVLKVVEKKFIVVLVIEYHFQDG